MIHFLRTNRAYVAVLALLGATLSCNSIAKNSFPADVQQLLVNGDKLEFFSLNPEWSEELSAEEVTTAPAAKPEPTRIHGWLALGSVEVTSPETRKELCEALIRGVEEHQKPWATCFAPRHMLRIRSGDDVTDILVCFQCSNGTIYRNGVRGKLFGVSQSPKARFNQVRNSASLPLAP